MNILALDTSMGVCSAAVLRTDGSARGLFASEEMMLRGHAEVLMPMIEEVMRDSGLAFSDLDLIAATLGPGSFTGVRIAIAAARGFALVRNAKLWGTDSLTVMAHVARGRDATAESKAPFAVAVDARRAMLYFALYDADGRKLEGPLLIAPEDAVSMLPETLTIAIGSGASVLAEAAAQQGRGVRAKLPDLQPNAASLAELALDAGETLPNLRPLYLRPPDAKPQSASVIARP